MPGLHTEAHETKQITQKENNMSRIQPVTNQNASEEVAAIFAEIKGAFGMVPNLFRTAAQHPPLLIANWNKVKALMTQGALSRKLKESIALVVSRDNSCGYCVAAHTGALKAIGIRQEEIDALENDLEKTSFSLKEKALLGFARKANKEPRNLTDQEFVALREAGASEAEIVEALGVMELFAGFNRFLDALQVDIDF